MARGQVLHKEYDASGRPIGKSNQNPILDTYLYELEVSGGEITKMYARWDVEGNEYLLLEESIDYGKNDLALSVEDQKVVINGRETLRKSTAGWFICCEWKDGSISWENLSNLKELHPIHVAKYTTTKGIQNEWIFNK